MNAYNKIDNENVIQKLTHFIENGGPEKNQYNELNMIWDFLSKDKAIGNNNNQMTTEIEQLFGKDFLEETVQGFAYRKPHGYAGDFEIIDIIYKNKITSNRKYEKWDIYFHAQEAPIAVRNRKKYFIELCKTKVSLSDKPLRILNIASGPCRDILELFENVPNVKLDIHCVEMDSKAIEYAKNLLGNHAHLLKFYNKNIFRFDIDEKFDFVWSAGLFDYFEDKVFVSLLTKIKNWCLSSGEIVIGNFSDYNPSRPYMEKMGEWFLHHRSAKELTSLAVEAGFEKNLIEIKSESLGINHFMHIVMPD